MVSGAGRSPAGEVAQEPVLKVVLAVEVDHRGVDEVLRAVDPVAFGEVGGAHRLVAHHPQPLHGTSLDRVGGGGDRGHHPPRAEQARGVLLVLAVDLEHRAQVGGEGCQRLQEPAGEAVGVDRERHLVTVFVLAEP